MNGPLSTDIGSQSSRRPETYQAENCAGPVITWAADGTKKAVPEGFGPSNGAGAHTFSG